VKQLSLGDEISAGITVRGNAVTDQMAADLCGPKLAVWQQEQNARLPDGTHFEAVDDFSQKPQGEYRLKRTLKVVHEDEN
jgi:hypothetical protein